jgi:hypothetical protein
VGSSDKVAVFLEPRHLDVIGGDPNSPGGATAGQT